MKDHLFIIGIGGTGMRCLEAFVHLCATGMFDNTELNILALDTDLDNGNFSRLKSLVEDAYLKVKGFEKQQFALENTFFSAKINFKKFTPDYSDAVKNGNFEALSRYAYADDKSRALADVLLTSQVRQFDLKHGYRAQTHLGSMLMYHAIIEEVSKNPHGELAQYIQAIYDAQETEIAKVFVTGSVFGGTGASSIPVVPKAFNEAIGILNPGKTLSRVDYGAVLMSAYFKFTPPDASLKSKNLVVAGSKNFALNSQVAMMFYNEDKTVRTVYRKFYMLGTPSNDFETPTELQTTVTGGALQKNDSHFVELEAAFAAYDFFNTDNSVFEDMRGNHKEVQYYYRTVSDSGRLDFKDFTSNSKTVVFAQKIAALTFLSYIVYPDFNDFAAAAQSGMLAKNNISGYEDISPREVAGLKKYLELFHFGINPDGQITDGWLRQLHRSAGGLNNFLFNAELFGVSDSRELKKLEINKKLFRDDDDDITPAKFSTGLFGSVFNSFKDEFVKQKDTEALQNKSEKLIKRMYDTVFALFGFKN